MVQLLSPLQPRSAGGTKRRQTWHEWLANPSMVSSVTLLAAAQLGGLPWVEVFREAAEAAFQAPARRGELVGQDQRIARTEERMAELEGEVETLRDELDTLRRQIGEPPPQGASLVNRVEAAEQRLGERARERKTDTGT
jgi:predicted RNase H-like nuclease (RuvC/YqgF family)